AALRTGHEAQRAIAFAAQAVVLAYLGQVRPARTAAAACLELTEATGAMGRSAAHGALGVLALSLGELDEAMRQLDRIVGEPLPGGIGEPDQLRFMPD